MKVFAKIVAGIGAVVFTATAVGLPDVCGYCTARAMSRASASHVVVTSAQQVKHARSTPVSLAHDCNERWQLPI